jgi:hypothetical protein
MAKSAFSRKQDSFHQQTGLKNLRKKLVKCYIWSKALYDAETCTLREIDQKHLGSSEVLCWRMEKISWTDRVRNEKVLHRSRRRGIS